MSLVLTYRVSRTIGFVHGGIAAFAAHFYWWLTYDWVNGRRNPNAGQGRLGQWPGLLLVVAIGERSSGCSTASR